MEHKIENTEEATILEITRLIKEFQEVFKDKTKQSKGFLTINELEILWSELKNNTEVLYSDMIRHLMNTIDERDLVRKKKESTPTEE
jgi:ribosomal protein L7/L12